MVLCSDFSDLQRKVQTSNVVTTHGGDRDSGVVMAERFFLFDGLYVSEKVW